MLTDTPGKTLAVRCGDCGGSGWLAPPQRLLEAAGDDKVMCGHCNGSGWVEKKR